MRMARRATNADLANQVVNHVGDEPAQRSGCDSCTELERDVEALCDLAGCGLAARDHAIGVVRGQSGADVDGHQFVGMTVATSDHFGGAAADVEVHDALLARIGELYGA